MALSDFYGTEYSKNNDPVSVGVSAVDLSRYAKGLAREQWVRVIIN